MSDTKTTGRKSPEYAPKSPEHGTNGGESKDTKNSDSKSDSKESKSSSKSESKASTNSEQRRQERSEKRASFFDKPKKESEKRALLDGLFDTKSDKESPVTETTDAQPGSEQATDEYKDGPIDVTEDPRFAESDTAESTESYEDTPDEIVEALAIDEYFNEAEELSEQEVHDALEGLVESRTHDIAHELHDTQPNSSEEFEALADAAFLESLRDRVDGSEDITEAVLDEAYQETLDDLDLEPGLEDDPVGPEHLDPSDESMVEGAEEGLVDDPDAVASPPTAPGGSHGGSGAGGGTPPPPVPPTSPPPGGAGYPPPPLYGPAGGHGAGVAPPPTPVSPGTRPPSPPSGPAASSVDSDRYYKRKRRKHLLTGALVGYIIGRRGGRKRTEKRLEPKIEKLEQQVTQLTDTVADREEKIRTIARAAAEKESAADIAQQSAEKPKQVAARKEKLAVRRKERKELRKAIENRDELVHSKAEAVGALGKLNLTSAEVFHEKRVYKELAIDGKEIPRKSVETMTKDELLIVIGDLEYDGVKVKEMVAGGRLEVSALREVVKQYMRGEKASAGERFEKTLLRELKPDPKELDSKRSVIETLHLDHPIARAGEHMKDLMPTHLLPEFMQPRTTRTDDAAHGAQLETSSGRKKRRGPNPMMPVWIVVVVTVIIIGLLLIISS